LLAAQQRRGDEVFVATGARERNHVKAAVRRALKRGAIDNLRLSHVDYLFLSQLPHRFMIENTGYSWYAENSQDPAFPRPKTPMTSIIPIRS
jgi:hypothetical protein